MYADSRMITAERPSSLSDANLHRAGPVIDDDQAQFLRLRPTRVVFWLFLITLGFATIAVAADMIMRSLDDSFLYSFLRRFRLNSEASLPAMWATCLLLLNAVLFAAIWLRESYFRSNWRHHWLFLSITFIFLAYDEAARVHEKLPSFARELMPILGAPEMLDPDWVVFGILFVLVAVMGFAYVRFVFALPWAVRISVIVAAVLFVGGALLVDRVAELMLELGGDTPAYGLTLQLEEFMEKLGQIVLTYALLRYLSTPDGWIVMRVRPIAT